MLSLWILISSSRAATLVVDTSGASGTYSSITDAIAAASDGDTIDVAAGTWYECIDLGGKSLDIVGAGSATTRLDGFGTCTTVLTMDSGELAVGFSGFTIANHGQQGVLVDAGSVTFDDVAWTDMGTRGTKGSALDIVAGDVTVTTASFDSTISGDISTGAIVLEDGTSLDVSDFSWAASAQIYVSAKSAATSLSLASGSMTAGGVYTTYGTVTLAGCDLSNAYLMPTRSTVAITDGTWNNASLTGTYGTVTIDGTTIENYAGTKNGAIKVTEGSLAVSNATFAKNSASTGSGGAIYYDTSTVGTTFTVVDSTFTGNSANTYGGAIYAAKGVTVSGSTFTSNKTTSSSGKGGAIYGGFTVSDSEFSGNSSVYGGALAGGSTITGSTFADDTASSGGASLYASSAVDIEDSTFSRESAGAIVAQAKLTISGSTFDGCVSTGNGGAISTNSAMTVDSSTFTDNQSTGSYSVTGGGAIYSSATSGTTSFTDTTFDGNSSATAGGAIYASYNLTFDGTWILNGTAQNGAGVYSKGDVTFTDGFVCGNVATTSGGGLYTLGIASSNTIWARNTAAKGGAIYTDYDPATITNDTVVANSATTGGGVYLASCFSGTDVFTNTIFAYTAAGNAVYGAATSCTSSTTYNDWYMNSAADSGGSYSFAAGGFGNLSVDPGFASFSTSGDCSSDSYALLSTSGVVDKGKSTILDTDGSRSDMGATGGPASTWTDADGDGWLEGWDCDDGDALVNPGATETCDGVDNDCDGDVDEGGSTPYYADGDGDGYGDASTSATGCDAPSGYVADATDCDDTRSAVNPGASETCDGLDDDCDGAIDEGVTTTYYVDADGDGHGSAAISATGCSLPSGYAADATDCDDANAAVSPDASESCDGVDDDCDGSVDEGLSVAWYRDADADGYGLATDTVDACAAPSGYVGVSGDCDDAASAVSPGGTEVCDGLDQDCDGVADDGLALQTYYADTDGDGYGDAASPVEACGPIAGAVDDASDCDDSDGGTHPGAAEVWYDGKDEACDGGDDDDQDGDGVAVADDCDDTDPSVTTDGCGDDTDTDAGDTDTDPGPGDTGTPDDSGSGRKGCGCAVDGAPSSTAPAGLAMLALALVRRRRE